MARRSAPLSVPGMESSLANRPVPASPVARRPARPTGVLRRARVALSSAVAAFWGLLPHLLHHVGPLAGAALFAGVGGTLLFGAIGLVAAVPFLLRVRRRCGNWRVPVALLATFAAMFSLSAFVIGPAIAGEDEPRDRPAAPATETPAPAGHEGHH